MTALSLSLKKKRGGRAGNESVGFIHAVNREREV